MSRLKGFRYGRVGVLLMVALGFSFVQSAWAHSPDASDGDWLSNGFHLIASAQVGSPLQNYESVADCDIIYSSSNSTHFAYVVNEGEEPSQETWTWNVELAHDSVVKAYDSGSQLLSLNPGAWVRKGGLSTSFRATVTAHTATASSTISCGAVNLAVGHTHDWNQN